MFPLPRMLEYGNIAPVRIPKIILAFNNLFLLYPNGDLYARGLNSTYQLGIPGSVANALQWTLVLQDVYDVYSSGASTLAIKNDGSFVSTGRNSYLNGGRIVSSNGDFIDYTAQFSAQGITKDTVRNICIGDNYILLNTTDDSLWVAGGNEFGQLGRGNTTSNQGFLLLKTDCKKINTTEFVSSYIDSNGYAHFCGKNSQGQIGNGNLVDAVSFNTITLPSGYNAIQTYGYGSGNSVGTSFILAKNNAGSTKLFASGARSNGSFGDGSSSGNTTSFIEIANMADIGQSLNGIEFHSYTSAVLGLDNKIYTSGFNSSGSIGNGTTAMKTIFSSDAIGIDGIDINYYAFGQNMSIVQDKFGQVWYTGNNAGITGLTNTTTFIPLELPR